MTASKIIGKYISFFEKRQHKRIENSSLVPQNDPTTLFTSAGMQPLVPFLLGEPHPMGKRLVNVQNCFRAQDIDEVGDNRHTTFFRMLGNWSLGDYFKKEEIPWFWEFLISELNINPKKLYISVFDGYKELPKDTESAEIWKKVLQRAGLNPDERIFYYRDNWWSRTGGPDNMPEGELGGPDTEVFYEFDVEHDPKFGKECHLNCGCGKFLEIGNSVLMQYQKQKDGGFKELPNKNVDFGGGLERLLAAVENQSDIFQTSLFAPIVKAIEDSTQKSYSDHAKETRIIVDHFTAASFITLNNVTPSNKEQGYVLRRLIRRGLDSFYMLNGKDITPVLETIAKQYKETDSELLSGFEKIKLTILEEEESYKRVLNSAKQYIQKKYTKKIGDELKGKTEITSDDAFVLYSTHGLSPTQIKSLGYEFNEQEFVEKMKEHQDVSRKGAGQKFHGGLADSSEQTVMGHTATHLLHQALRDVLGSEVHQTGSNITSERLRFDFNYDKKLTDEQVARAEQIVNEKIKENLPVHFEMMNVGDAKKLGAIGLFDEKYQEKVKVYYIGDYSKEFCGGPHVEFTSKLKRVKIIKQENIGHGQRRVYATVG